MKRAVYAIPNLVLTSLAAACGGGGGGGGGDGDGDDVDPIINEFNVVVSNDLALPYTYDDGVVVFSAVSSTMVVNDDLSASFTISASNTYNGQTYAYDFPYTGTFAVVEVGVAYTIALDSVDGDVINLDCTMDADVNLDCTDDEGEAWNFAPL